MRVLSENNVFRQFDGIKVSKVSKTIEIHFDDCSFLKCTPEHKILANKNYVYAKDIAIGDIVITQSGTKEVIYKEINFNDEYVFDLVEVEDTHNYFTNDTLTHQCLYLDEIGFVQNSLAEEFFTSVYPTIISSKESKIILTSTPNGFNHFYKFWNEAEKGVNGFYPIRVTWQEMPDRDIKWYNEQVKVLGELKAAQEIDVSFLGSSRQLLTSATMNTLSASIPLSEFGDGQYKGLKIYKQPEDEHIYTMSVDVSRGRHLDSSAFMIFDVTTYPHKIVCSYNNPNIAPLMYAGFVHDLAKRYNDAYILVEINDIGAQVAEELYHTYEYENLYWTKSGDELGKKGSDPYPGVRTTKKTKRIGCANLKDIIEKQQLIVDDLQAIQELSTFVQNDAGTWEADEGFHDDAVTCLWLHAWVIMQPWFIDLTDKSMRDKLYQNLEKQLEDELLPFFVQDAARDRFDVETPEDLGMRHLIYPLMSCKKT
jgi:hypothetical protein